MSRDHYTRGLPPAGNGSLGTSMSASLSPNGLNRGLSQQSLDQVCRSFLLEGLLMSGIPPSSSYPFITYGIIGTGQLASCSDICSALPFTE